jgi:3-oxoadipate enol-lactonase
LRLQGERLHYRLDGPSNAPGLVLAHSIGTTFELWDAQVASLAERFRVLRYDHRGHGASAVPPGPYTVEDLGFDLIELLDRLDFGTVHFCGLSLGGMVGMWLASTVPDRVDRLCLCATSACFGASQEWYKRASDVRKDGLGVVCDAVLDRWFTPEFRSSHPEKVSHFAQMLRSTPPEGYAACCEAIAEFDIRTALEAIRAKTLVICGAEDQATPIDHGRLIETGVDDAELVVIEGAAHLVNVEKPEHVGQSIVDHMTENGASR